MRIRLLLLPLLLLIAWPGFSAFHAATAWDVRSTGADTNGGGFQVGATGTDYSQQNGPQFNYVDIVIGATTTQGTSVARAFSVVDPGNIINITAGAGCTVQRVQVVSQAAGVATFDKSLGVAASTCTGDLGGALATTTLAASLMVWGNTMWVQTGTYTVTSTSAIPGGPNISSIVGFNSTHGDNGTRPLITTSTNSTPLFIGAGTRQTLFRNLSLSNTAATRAVALTTNAVASGVTTIYLVNNVKFDGFTTSVAPDNSSRPILLYMTDSEVMNSTVNAINPDDGLFLYRSFIHDNTGSVRCPIDSKALCSIQYNVIVDNTGVGITADTAGIGAVTILSNTVARNTSHGISTTSNVSWTDLRNNILYGNGGWGAISSASAPIIFTGTNAYGSNALGDLSGYPAGAGDVALGSDPFTNSAGDDYSLNSTAGGGAACKGAGIPGPFLGSSTTGYLDIGGVQSQGTGGSTVVVVSPPISH